MIARHHTYIYRGRCSLIQHPYSSVSKATSPLTTLLTPLVHRAFFTPALGKLINTRETPGHGDQPKMPEDEDFYRFTRARFVWDEDYEMSQRYVRYNVNQLAQLAAAAVGSKSCVSIEKCLDGMHNKALLLTMDDGTQAIAKVANPNAGRPHFTTASEVATMDFVRRIDLLHPSLSPNN